MSSTGSCISWDDDDFLSHILKGKESVVRGYAVQFIRHKGVVRGNVDDLNTFTVIRKRYIIVKSNASIMHSESTLREGSCNIIFSG